MDGNEDGKGKKIKGRGLERKGEKWMRRGRAGRGEEQGEEKHLINNGWK